MSFRSFLSSHPDLLKINAPISKTYEIAGVLKQIEPRPALFEQVKESQFRVAGNLLSSKAEFARYFGIQPFEIIPLLASAIENRTPCPVVSEAPCQDVVDLEPDLDEVPILRHCALDGGNYISSGVVIARHPDYGQNADFHRMMQLSKREMAVRVVRGRHFDRFLKDQKALDVAVCIGCAPNVLAAAATSVELAPYRSVAAEMVAVRAPEYTVLEVM